MKDNEWDDGDQFGGWELVQGIVDAACALYDSGDFDLEPLFTAVREFRERS